jgi:hypothetical protein
MNLRPAFILLLAGAVLPGCRRDKPPVEAKVSLQPMHPYAPEENPEGLEEMPDDDQGVIYF